MSHKDDVLWGICAWLNLAVFHIGTVSFVALWNRFWLACTLVKYVLIIIRLLMIAAVILFSRVLCQNQICKKEQFEVHYLTA